jgi:glycosyltransferase involved in cell wall biosynthesis
MTSAKVAIITRTKNRPLLLRRCIESVVNQTFQDWLHVIVNDGGDPTTVEGVVAAYTGKYGGRVRMIHNETSVGMQNASNIGIRAVDSEFIAIHDDDDSWNPMFLAECVGYLDEAGIDSTEQGVAVQSIWINEEIDSLGNIVELSRTDYLPFESISLFQTASRNAFPPIAFLYRRKAHDTIGYFNQAFNELGDHDFNLRFLSHFDIGTLSKRLAGYHWRHQSNGSGYGNTVTDGVASHRKVLVKMQNHYLRQDLANQRLGLGFLINISAGFEGQLGWTHGLYGKSDSVANSVRRIMKKLQYYERILDAFVTPWKGNALPRRIYDHFSDMFQKSPENIPAYPGQTSTAQLGPFLKKARVVSLDVFDTALFRLVRKPTDVFLFIQHDVRQLLNRPNLGFVAIRVAAEEEARRELRCARGTGEVSLSDIYSVLQRRLDCDGQTIAKIKQLELEAERHLLRAHPGIVQIAAQSMNGDRKLVFSSDMYLSSDEITVLLEQNGFKKAPVFVSSELLVTKHDGELFDRVAAACQCDPEEILHIGDNLRSDVERARSKRLAAWHWSRSPSETPLVDQQTSMSGAWEGDLASSLYTGLVRRRRLSHPVKQTPSKEFWEMIGYEVAGPLYHAFISWTIERARQLGLKRLFFLARDGFQLLKVFNLFREKQALGIEAAYLFASRRLWNVARIDRFDEENLAFLTTPNPCLRVGDFLTRIGINPAPHEALARRIGFAGLNQRITTDNGAFISETEHKNIRLLFREFESQILELAAQERAKLLDYFADIGLLQDGSGIVDIGWQASSSRSLDKLLALGGHARKIPGFYFGTWCFAQAAADAGCQFESFFLHVHKPAHRASLIAEGVELFESFFAAPHPTIVGLDRKNGKWEATYGEPEIDSNMESALQVATGTAFEFVRDALAVWPDSQKVPPPFGYLETTLDRLLRHPKPDEAAALGKFSLRNSFGGFGPIRHLANLPSSWARISRGSALQQAYDACYWKKGFLAQLSPRMIKQITV